MPTPSKKAEQVGRRARVIAMTVSTTAAVLSIFTFARAWGFIGEPHSIYTVGSLGVRWLGITPAADTAQAIGDTIHLAARVTGRSGTALVGATIGWSSDDPNVATVDENGMVITRGSGTTTIIATVGKLVARARISVRQQVATVRIAGDTSIVLAEGDRQLLPARAHDSRGHLVRRSRVLWSSSDTSVVLVDSAGLVAAVRPGRATLTAVIDSIAGHAPVTVAAVPASVAIVAGAEQRAAAGAALPQPLVVRVLDKRGEPVVALPIRFRTGEADGTPEHAIAFTDNTGRARTGWTLGDLPGRQRLFASVDRVDSALVVVAEAEPTPLNTVWTPVRNTQTARISEQLAEPVGIRLTDSTGRALVDVPVSWTVLDGGRIEAIDARTDSLGEARATWTLGRTAGVQRARVQIGRGRTVPPATLTATALAGAPAVLSVVSGDGQRGPAGAPLPKQVVVKVSDAGGNAVADASVSLAASGGGLVDSLLTTDSLGVVSLRWTLGRAAGGQRLTARVEGVSRELTVRAAARASEPANIGFGATPADGAVGRPLKDAVTITVTDVFGNPVPNATVSFTTRTGSVSPARVVTDERGRARTRWTLGTAAGEQVLAAAVRGTDVRSTVAVIGKAAAPATTQAKPSTAKPAAKPAASRSAGGRSTPGG